MGMLGDLIKTLSDALGNGRGRSSARAPQGSRTRPQPPGPATGTPSGEFGTNATMEVDPRRIGRVRMRYSPDPDGTPDPGEIVWTWVPFEENNGRGKDRPVLVVAVEAGGTYLAVQLTSKDHDGEGDYVAVGAGGWDDERRPSWVDLDRIIRVHEAGMRREAAALPRADFDRVSTRLRERYGWS